MWLTKLTMTRILSQASGLFWSVKFVLPDVLIDIHVYILTAGTIFSFLVIYRKF